MSSHVADRVQSAVFISLVLLVAWTAAPLADGLVLALSPLLVTVVMVASPGWRPGPGRLGVSLRPAGLSWWWVAVATTAGVTLIAYLALLAIGLVEPREPSWQLAVDLVVLLTTGTVLAFCEEIGWRGYLQPRVATWAGRRSSHLVVGAVWLVWHLAYITRTDGYHADGNRLAVLGLFSLSVMAFAVLFGELRDRSGSVWPAVIAHMAHNVTLAWLGTSVLRTNHPVVVEEYLVGDTGLLVLAGNGHGGCCADQVWPRWRDEPRVAISTCASIRPQSC